MIKGVVKIHLRGADNNIEKILEVIEEPVVYPGYIVYKVDEGSKIIVPFNNLLYSDFALVEQKERE